MFNINKNDLSKLSENGHRFELRHPITAEPTGAFLTVRGSESPKVKALGRKMFMQHQQKEMQAKRKGREPEPMSIDEAEDFAVEDALVRLLGWEGIVETDPVSETDVEIPFNEVNARRILAQHSWMRTEISDKSNDLGNFKGK